MRPVPPSREAAFDALVAAHTERLCRFVYRYVDSREAAEDIVQELFLAIWERGHEWEAPDPLPYLYKAARNRAISYARHTVVRDRHESSVIAQSADHEAADNTIEAELAESELARAVTRAIEQLPEKCRLVFTMSREQGLAHAQIGQILGLSTKTIESHIWRALTHLRTSLAPYMGALLLSLISLD